MTAAKPFREWVAEFDWARFAEFAFAQGNALMRDARGIGLFLDIDFSRVR